MSLEEYTPDLDSSESWWNSAEAAKEAVSEKFKESIKRAIAWTQKTQKDEKKAKRYDFILASFLVKIIIDKKYDSLLQIIFKTIDYWYATNMIVWILSLVNSDISFEIRKKSNKEFINFDYDSNYWIHFDDTKIPDELKQKINIWIEDIIDSMIIEYSSIQNEKNIKLLEKDNELIVNFIASVFIFFLKYINIKITNNKALSIADFIKQEIKNALKKVKLEKI